VEDWNWETIFYGHYRSVFNHRDIIGLKSYYLAFFTEFDCFAGQIQC